MRRIQRVGHERRQGNQEIKILGVFKLQSSQDSEFCVDAETDASQFPSRSATFVGTSKMDGVPFAVGLQKR